MADLTANPSAARKASLPRINSRLVVMTLYLVFLMLPI
jgi:glycerol transport system permease protein